MVTNCLAACVYVTIIVSEIQCYFCEIMVILSYTIALDVPVKGVAVAISAPSLGRKN